MEGFRGSGELPLDSEHPGDSFGPSFSPRSSFSDQFEAIFMILDDLGLDLGVLGSSGAVLGVLWEGLGSRTGPQDRPGCDFQPNNIPAA